MEATEGLSSPKLFRKWAAITAVGACLERRTWTITAKGPTFPNLYTILIGRPGIGKSEAINGVTSIIKSTALEGHFEQACNLAPVDVTKSALYDYLAKASVRRTGPDPADEALGNFSESHYHSAFLAVSELSDLVREHDTQLLSALHGLYDCLPMVEEERRYRADNPIKIPRAQISLLGGTTPAYISRTFPASAWDEGFMARAILIYSDEFVEPDLFGESGEGDPLVIKELQEDLRKVGVMKGQFYFTDEAKKAIITWQKHGREPKPNHPRLEHYNTRRLRHALKLSQIAAASHSNAMYIQLDDFQEALSWMHEAEAQMPKIFLEMVGKSDGQVLEGLYHFVSMQWNSPSPALNGQPIAHSLLVNHLKYKVPSYQIKSIIDMACEADLLEAFMAPNGKIVYKPKPKKRPN